MKFTMFEVKKILLEKKISNKNEIQLLFDTESTLPCLFPLLFSLKTLRFQSDVVPLIRPLNLVL